MKKQENQCKKLIRRGKIKKSEVYNNKETCYTLLKAYLKFIFISST